MPNNTFEDYKIAIQEKYKIEKEGVNFNFLNPPSQANLRNLCWEIFKSNTNNDDLSVFHSFFEFEFDLTKKNYFKEQKDRFRPIGSFLKDEKIPANRFAVELAAILVDFNPRPYSKFRKIGLLKEEIEVSDEFDSLILEEVMENEESERKDEDASIVEDLLINKKDTIKFSEKFQRKLKGTIMTTTIIFCLIAIVIYFAFFKKDCMQWAGDYYEKVDCIQEIKSLDLKPYDEIQFGLKKINVSDTTSFFKLGEPCIWYGKSVDGNYECFNIPGLHPETGKTLKPITQYIVDKYLLKNKE